MSNAFDGALVATLDGGDEPFQMARPGIDLAWSCADSLRSLSCSADRDLCGCSAMGDETLWCGGWLARGALLAVEL